MTNEEFQSIVLKQLGELKEDVSGLKEDVSGLKEDVTSLKAGQARIEERLERVENRAESIENKLDAVHDQTAVLTEFRTEANIKLDSLCDENKAIYEIIGRHEVEISILKRKAV